MGEVVAHAFFNHDYKNITIQWPVPDPAGITLSSAPNRQVFLLNPNVSVEDFLTLPLSSLSAVNVLSRRISTHTDKLYLLYSIDRNEKITSISPRDSKGRSYGVLPDRDFDVKEADLLGIQNRTINDLQNLLVNDRLVLLSQSVKSPNENKIFSVNVNNGQLIFFACDRSPEFYCSAEKDTQENYILKVPSFTSDQVTTYLVKINEEGIVTLSDYLTSDIAVGSGVSVKLQPDQKTFKVSYGGADRGTGQVGSAFWFSTREDGADGFPVFFNFDQDGRLSGFTIVQDQDHDLKVKLQAGNDGQLYVTQTERYWRKSVLEERQIFNQDGSYLFEKLCVAMDCSKPFSQLIIYKDKNAFHDGLDLVHNSIQDQPRSLDEIFVNLTQWADSTTSPLRVRFELIHYANGKVFKFYRRSSVSDWTSFELLRLQVRDTNSIRALIELDWLLEEGQIITATDGQRFKLVQVGSTVLDIRKLTKEGSIGFGDEVVIQYDQRRPTGLFVRGKDGIIETYFMTVDALGLIHLEN